MIVLLCVLLTLACFWWIFFGQEPLPHDDWQQASLRALRERKQAVLENLKDLHFEYLAGKLSDEDYGATRRELETEVASLNTRIDSAAAALSKN